MRTQKERERDDRNESVCQLYLQLRNEQPQAAPYRIFSAIAQKHNLSQMGVMRIVERAGLYQPNR